MQTDDLTGGVLLAALGWTMWTSAMLIDTTLSRIVLMFGNLFGREVIVAIFPLGSLGFTVGALMILIEPTGIYETTLGAAIKIIFLLTSVVAVISAVAIYFFGIPLPK